MAEDHSSSAEYVSNRTRVTSDLLGSIVSDEERAFIEMATQLKDAWPHATSTLYSSKIMERALDNHAKALINAAKATDKNAASLTRATWMLAFATVVLVLVTLGLWLGPIG